VDVVTKSTKPAKKTDAVLFELIERSIRNVDYVFLPHARARLAERTILEPVVLDILEGRKGTERRRHKRKDSFKCQGSDWNYCIEGIDPNARKIRIIVSFHEKTMPIITVMWVGRYEDEN
jgi:hypothetical protein